MSPGRSAIDLLVGQSMRRTEPAAAARRGSSLVPCVEGLAAVDPPPPRFPEWVRAAAGVVVLECYRGRQVVEPVTAFTGQRGWRHIQVSGEIERHCPVEEAAHGFNGVGRSATDALERLVDGICVGEDAVGGFPVRMLVGGAETRYDPVVVLAVGNIGNSCRYGVSYNAALGKWTKPFSMTTVCARTRMTLFDCGW
jgi:hypothetical protein